MSGDDQRPYTREQIETERAIDKWIRWAKGEITTQEYLDSDDADRKRQDT